MRGELVVDAIILVTVKECNARTKKATSQQTGHGGRIAPLPTPQGAGAFSFLHLDKRNFFKFWDPFECPLLLPKRTYSGVVQNVR